MEENPLTRSYLESLSTDELARLADSLGVDVPPGLDRPFIIEELLENAAEDEDEADSLNPLEASLFQDDFIEPLVLPKKYNITYIEVMIRDPFWAFVFWEVRGSDRELFENSPDFEGYCLRVSPGDKQEPAVRERITPQDAEKAGVFFVSIGPDDCAWYLGFPSEDGPGSDTGHTAAVMANRKKCYKVELCAERGGEELLLAVSRPFMLPKLPDRPMKCGESGVNPLIRLSGAGDFPILRNGDRLPRNKYL
jgi:hypothetical protein